jgi:vacuolar-type H+-ATPase subunit I/STV1
MKRVEILYYDDKTEELVAELEDFRILRFPLPKKGEEKPRFNPPPRASAEERAKFNPPEPSGSKLATKKF